MHSRLLFAIFVLFSITVGAQVPSPEQYLGYKVGTRFTPHWKIVGYYQAVAAAAPNLVKLEKYGETYEGRTLMVAYVSTAGNIANLESIRTANLKLSTDARATASAGAPAIVWMSYNVHGNEASSSEASMLTLFALVDPANSRTKQWLQNTVVILDPCINPDGRDRYVNWFNSIVGRTPDPALVSREHDEPWPGGRPNHYNFDLNRDWSWHTQIETQQRVALYNRWLPQIHVDFHEQFINEPYYFPPAAEPYHEVITSWQREFQELIGRNHARYFDQNGWLYFTKEKFDLAYPAYGDTYPLFSGAIGMTYEQAGHSLGGLAAVTNTGDTLTLADRALHHHTTGLSTVEVASQQAGRLVSEFQKFFAESQTRGFGTYKTYIIRNRPEDAQRVRSLLQLLDRNGIRYGSVRGGSARGFSYLTGKEEGFTIGSGDIAVSAVQPKSALVKVLFEPSTRFQDSLTYDITAWALPYAYGLTTWATTQRLDVGAYQPAETKAAALPNDPYAYVIRWNGLQSAKLAGQLMQAGIRLRFNELPFETGGQRFERGAILVVRTSNQYVPNLWQTVRRLANEQGVELTAVNTGFSDKGNDFGSLKVRAMKAPRVALLTGEGVSPYAAGAIWHFFDRQLEYPVSLVNAASAASMNWNDFDVVILPNGSYGFLNEKAQSDAVKSWVNAGGHLIALESAAQQLAKNEWGPKQKKIEAAASNDPYEVLRPYEGFDRESMATNLTGSIYKVELDNTHPLAFGFPGHYFNLKTTDHIYEFIREGGWNVGVVKKDGQVAGFVGSKMEDRLQDGMLFGVQNMGAGHVTYLADDVLFRSFWENGKLMLANAVFLVGQ